MHVAQTFVIPYHGGGMLHLRDSTAASPAMRILAAQNRDSRIARFQNHRPGMPEFLQRDSLREAPVSRIAVK